MGQNIARRFHRQPERWARHQPAKNFTENLEVTFRLSLPLQTFSKSPSGRLSPVR